MTSVSSTRTQSIITDTAQVKYHENHKAPLILLPRCVTLALLLQWEEFAITYFNRAKTIQTDRVSSILTCFKDAEMDNWLKMNCDCLRKPTFTFTMFMSELRKQFLEVQWENQIM
jgi:hypothetical protein